MCLYENFQWRSVNAPTIHNLFLLMRSPVAYRLLIASIILLAVEFCYFKINKKRKLSNLNETLSCQWL